MILSGSNSSGNFQPAPDGMHQAVLVDVIDEGEKETPWGKKHKVCLVWEIDAPMDNGRRFTVRKYYTASLNEKGNLRKDLKGWFGRDLNAEELKRFDLENLLGRPCSLFVEQSESAEGKVYANVKIVSKPGKSPIGPSGDYTRAQDRDSKPGPRPFQKPSYAQAARPSAPAPAPAPTPEPGDDEDVPF